jgi:hypothetical protein
LESAQWTKGRRYLGLDVLTRCRLRPVAEVTANSKEATIPALSAEQSRRSRAGHHTPRQRA